MVQCCSAHGDSVWDTAPLGRSIAFPVRSSSLEMTVTESGRAESCISRARYESTQGVSMTVDEDSSGSSKISTLRALYTQVSLILIHTHVLVQCTLITVNKASVMNRSLSPWRVLF